MANLMDYLDWRGGIPLDRVPLNEVDALILATLCYNRMGDRIGGDAGLPLRELAPLVPPLPPEANIYYKKRREMMLKMAATERFGGICLRNYVDILDRGRSMQFSAVTIDLPDGTAYVAFRGTDSTLVGWREDFMMSYETPVNAQEAAAVYLMQAAEKHHGPLMCGGHSKGGNLAAWAAAKASAPVRRRLRAVYSFDGPGLDEETAASEGYREILPVLRSLVPQSSVVGMLLAYHENYEVVRADSAFIWQHNVFSWEVLGGSLVRNGELTQGAGVIQRAVQDWIEHYDRAERKLMVETVFRVLAASGAQTIGDLKADLLGSALRMLEESHELRKDQRDKVLGMLAGLVKSGSDSFLRDLSDKSRTALEALGGMVAGYLKDLGGRKD